MFRGYTCGITGIYTRINSHDFINYLLLFIKETDICDFAENTALYVCGKDIDIISNKLELETNKTI